MSDGGEVAHDAKGIVDAVLSCAALLGIPPITLGAAGAKVLIDLGFAFFFHETERALREALGAAAAGGAAARSSAATTAIERERAAPLTCGGQLQGRDARVFHGADCATSIGCGRGIA